MSINNGIFTPPQNPFLLSIKRKIFISYHHDNDQYYYDEISRVFSRDLNLVKDNSLDRQIDSDNPEYVYQRIRDKYITGTSCTLVLCGPHTRWRKYVDWEIKATLDKQHGLIGINLPINPKDMLGRVHKPDRLQDNINSGYAVWSDWNFILSSMLNLNNLIEQANSKSFILIDNNRQLRKYNRSFL